MRLMNMNEDSDNELLATVAILVSMKCGKIYKNKTFEPVQALFLLGYFIGQKRELKSTNRKHIALVQCVIWQ